MFDVRVIDTDAPSYSNRAVVGILSSAKKKYDKAADVRRASFTLFLLSVSFCQEANFL